MGVHHITYSLAKPRGDLHGLANTSHIHLQNWIWIYYPQGRVLL